MYTSWPGTYQVEQPGLELATIFLPQFPNICPDAWLKHLSQLLVLEPLGKEKLP